MADLDLSILTQTPYVDPLTGVAILERDTSYNIMWTWMYPGLPTKDQKVLRANSSLGVRTPPATQMGSLGSLYTYTTHVIGDAITVAGPARTAFAAATAAREAGEDAPELDEETMAALEDPDRCTNLDKTSGFALIVVADEFWPEKYEALGSVLANVYAATGEPGNVLQAYFKALFKGKVDAGPLGAYNAAELDIRNSWLAASIKDVIVTLGPDVVLVWGAMLLGKRVLVYSDTRESLAPFLRALPLFVWHKKDWSLLIPFTGGSDEELAYLATKTVYAAGTTSSALIADESLYDVLVNVSDRSVSIASSSSADLNIGAFVKDLAAYLVNAGNDPDMSDGDTIKGLAVKTGELLKKVKSLAQGDDPLTLDSLAAQGIQGALARFLFNIAVAEGLASR